MPLGLSEQEWNLILNAVKLVFDGLILLTVIIATTLTVATYRANSRRQAQRERASREADTRSLELRLDNPFVRIHSTYFAPEGERPCRPEDAPDETWDVISIRGRDGSVHTFLAHSFGGTTISATNFGERDMRIARIEYESGAYLEVTGRGTPLMQNGEGMYSLANNYRSDKDVRYWTPMQEDGAVSGFPWVVDAPVSTAARIEGGASGVVADLRGKTADLVRVLLSSYVIEPEAAPKGIPVVLSFVLRAYWTIDSAGRLWEHRGNSVTELRSLPD